jgi:hypothetical protein
MKKWTGLLLWVCAQAWGGEISFTMDDPRVNSTPMLSAPERDQRILAAFEHFNVKGALFVCGMRVDSAEGRALLKTWDEKGHLIASHSYSHENYNSPQMTFEKFRDDVLRDEPLISGLPHFARLFRYPYLKEGDTAEKRDALRAFLKSHGYSQGYVTIDASDWYVDARLAERLKKDPQADVAPYRQYYLQHLWDRATFYDALAKQVFGRPIKHTLLIHHSLLNALFLADVMQMFQQKGWTLISASEAFQDPVFKLEPKTLPAGESIVWASAKLTGRFESKLRYPAEDEIYEKDAMDKLGL